MFYDALLTLKQSGPNMTACYQH